MQIRLQKLISQAGITSRRKAETLITDGCVTINGRIVTELGTKADPERDHVKVNGKLLRFESPSIYLMLNKPAGFITTLNDPEGRPTVMNLVRHIRGRLYPVGRLDYHTEGLLLLTNDGALAHRLMHPSSGVMKRYHAKIKGVVEDDQIARLSRGVKLGDGTTAPCTINKLRLHDKNSWLEVILHEGRYRQVRRMFESINRQVIKLRRVGYAGLKLGDLPVGECRRLTPEEVDSLYRVVGRAAGGSAHERPVAEQAPGPAMGDDRSVTRPAGRPDGRSSERPGQQPGHQAKKRIWKTNAPPGRRDIVKQGWRANAPSGRRFERRDVGMKGPVNRPGGRSGERPNERTPRPSVGRPGAQPGGRPGQPRGGASGWRERARPGHSTGGRSAHESSLGGQRRRERVDHQKARPGGRRDSVKRGPVGHKRGSSRPR